jgi:hypothetical protein
MKERSFDEMIAYFNRRVSEMDIAQDYKMELLGMVTALGYKHEKMKPLEEATLYGYPLEELIMFARACIACGITAEDMKQFAANHDFIVKALKQKWEEVMDGCTKQR